MPQHGVMQWGVLDPWLPTNGQARNLWYNPAPLITSGSPLQQRQSFTVEWQVCALTLLLAFARDLSTPGPQGLDLLGTWPTWAGTGFAAELASAPGHS